MTEKKNDETLAGMPKAPAKQPKREQLFVAFDRDLDGNHGVVDAVIYGTKLEALEYAIEQDPKWEVVTIHKGQSLRAALTV